MKPWRVIAAWMFAGAAVYGLFAGPEDLRTILVWAFFFAIPGALALMIAGARKAWAYVIAGAFTGCLGLTGSAHTVLPGFDNFWAPALVGAIFGLGWKFLLRLQADSPREAVGAEQSQRDR